MRGQDTYRPALWLRNGHIHSITASFRRVSPLFGRRERLETSDGDFFDLDFFPVHPVRRADRLVLLSHGLEGHSRRPYMLGMARIFQAYGWDAAARNFRGCSGEPNRLPGIYHAGQTEDVDTAVRHCIALGYSRVFLVGFSMGGNQILKYLGEDPERVPEQVVGGAAVSVPCDMEGAAAVLSLPSRRLYMIYFLHTLRAKIRLKHICFPEHFDIGPLNRIRTFDEFDELYTAPLHGFASARDYRRRSASLPVLDRICSPVLILNALDDPFLSSGCFPYVAAGRNRHVRLETPRWGGHVGFLQAGPHTWAEKRTIRFAEGLAGKG